MNTCPFPAPRPTGKTDLRHGVFYDECMCGAWNQRLAKWCGNAPEFDHRAQDKILNVDYEKLETIAAANAIVSAAPYDFRASAKNLNFGGERPDPLTSMISLVDDKIFMDVLGNAIEAAPIKEKNMPNLPVNAARFQPSSLVSDGRRHCICGTWEVESGSWKAYCADQTAHAISLKNIERNPAEQDVQDNFPWVFGPPGTKWCGVCGEQNSTTAQHRYMLCGTKILETFGTWEFGRLAYLAAKEKRTVAQPAAGRFCGMDFATTHSNHICELPYGHEGDHSNGKETSAKKLCALCTRPIAHAHNNNNNPHAVFCSSGCAKDAAMQLAIFRSNSISMLNGFAAADRALRFIAGLNLQDHAVSEQREAVSITSELMKALKPGKAER